MHFLSYWFIYNFLIATVSKPRLNEISYNFLINFYHCIRITLNLFYYNPVFIHISYTYMHIILFSLFF